jgi:selenocysteine lyase/cysteine desulfurase
MDDVFPAIRYIVQHNLPYANTLFVPFLGRDPIEVIKNNLAKNLKVVVLELAHYLTGEMIALKPLIEFCREKDIYLVVDGIQGIGAINFDVQETDVDFLACGAGKWLFGPTGAGFLYVNKRHFRILKGLHAGWLGAQWSGFNDCQISPPLYRDARMFELGSRNIVGISALVENINTPFEPPQSGILTVRPPQDAKAIFDRLCRAKIIVSLRSNCLRFSPHFYNTREEIEEIFDVLSY